MFLLLLSFPFKYVHFIAHSASAPNLQVTTSNILISYSGYIDSKGKGTGFNGLCCRFAKLERLGAGRRLVMFLIGSVVSAFVKYGCWRVGRFALRQLL